MPSLDSVFAYLQAVWQMALGRRDRIRDLDLSADGFWESFWAIGISVPPLLVTWVAFSAELAAETGAPRMPLVLMSAVIDIVTWLVPVAAFVLVASRSVISDRVVAYVVATNWGSALVLWTIWVPSMMRLMFPQSADLAETISFVLFIATLVFMWRLTDAAIDRGPVVTSVVFIAMFAVSLVLILAMQQWFGIA